MLQSVLDFMALRLFTPGAILFRRRAIYLLICRICQRWQTAAKHTGLAQISTGQGGLETHDYRPGVGPLAGRGLPCLNGQEGWYPEKMVYVIEQRIHTLAENAIITSQKQPSFTAGGIEFIHWNFNVTQGWSQDFWLAKAKVEADNYQVAFNSFRSSARRIIPRISLISQCYIESVSQPFLIVKQGTDRAFFRFTKDVPPVGLMFMEEQLKALRTLCRNTDVPEEFYYYWNDVVNASGYTPKLGLMFCAIEALAKTLSGKKDWKKLEEILGKDLLDEIYAPTKGLRHRLSHGEYFTAADPGKNYVHILHARVMAYFNKSVFGDRLLEENIVAPQRHLFGNKEEVRIFIKPRSAEAELVLKDVLDDFEQNGINRLAKYEPVFDYALQTTY
jgi:hypothetical protein